MTKKVAKKDKPAKDKPAKARAAKDKPANAGKIPKQIAGVKLSKTLRKSGEKLIERAQTPEGRRVIAAGLAMAGAAVARAKTPPVPPVPPVPPQAAQSGEGAPPPTPPAPTIDPAQIAEAVGQAATAFFDGLFGRKR